MDYLCFLCLVFLMLFHGCLVITCWERAVLALVGYVYCIFVAKILGQVWYLIVSFPDFGHLSYF